MQPRISVFMAMSLDGFIADSNGGVEWLNALTDPQNLNPEDYGYGALMGSIDVLVMGRSTLEQVLTFDGWPYSDRPVIVLSHRPAPEGLPPEARITIAAGSPAELVRSWTDQGFKHIYLDGGQVVQDFLAADLIDDMTLTQVPAMLGLGIPLFREHFHHDAWSLAATTAYENGFVQRVLKRKRARDNAWLSP